MMESKHLNFRFQIQEKPEGSFVSVSENPELNFDGATKEEVEQKVLAKIGEMAGPQVVEALKTLEGKIVDAGEGELHKPGIHVEKKFSVTINNKTFSKTLSSSDSPLKVSAALPGMDPVSRDTEPAISRQMLWLIIIGLTLLTAWLLLHRH